MALDEPLVRPLAELIEVLSVPGQLALRPGERDVSVSVIGILVNPIDVPGPRSVSELFVHHPAGRPTYLAVVEPGGRLDMVRDREHDRPSKASIPGTAKKRFAFLGRNRPASRVAERSTSAALDVPK